MFLPTTDTIDAILTKLGREKLSKGQFKPTKFALSDDFIDYGLLASADGEAKILATKILEASSLGDDSNSQLKYKLVSSPQGIISMAQLIANPNEMKAKVYDLLTINLRTDNVAANFTESYTIVNSNSKVTLMPEYAIEQLNKQLYISGSGKDFTTLMNHLERWGEKEMMGRFGNDPGSYPEVLTIGNTANLPVFKIFVFDTFTTPVKISIKGNTTGAVTNFYISRSTFLLEEPVVTET